MTCNSFFAWITDSSGGNNTGCTTTFDGTFFCGAIPGNLSLKSLEEVILVGCVGIMMYVCVFSFGLFTFLQHRVAAKKVKTFYVCVMISSALEVVTQSGLAMCAAPSSISFAFHILSEQMLLVSFSMVLLWWSTTICGQKRVLITTLLVILNVLQVGGAMVIIIYDLTVKRGDFAGFITGFVYHVQAYSLWVSEVLLAFTMLTASLVSSVGCRVQNDVTSTQQQALAQRFRYCLSITTLICAVCFLVRVVMGILTQIHGRNDNTWIDAALWYISAYWIPTAAPSVCMLILWRPNSKTRKQVNSPIYGHEPSTPPLIPSEGETSLDYYQLDDSV